MENVCPKCRRSYASTDVFCPEDGSRLAAASDAPTKDEAVPPPHADDPLLGTILDGRYELTKLLGEGGMGRVYLARQLLLERPVAVKIIHRNRVNDPSDLVRFKQTAVHASTIVDDHVAQVYDFGETPDGLVYLAMEYVPGDTLTRVIKSEGPFEPKRVAEITRQIAKGLDAAHVQGIIHRDLKPDNIMLMRDRHGREMVKIVDFGIAKALGAEGGGITQTGAIVGTLVFMSPEQLAGGALDRRSDLYSLALVVFHMLTGALPFGGTTPEEVIYARFDTSGPRPLAAVRPAVPWPGGLQAVIDRALARDAATRYETAGEFAAAFSTSVTTPVVPSPAPRVPPNVRRKRPRIDAAIVQWKTQWIQANGRQIGRVSAIGVLAILALTVATEVVKPWWNGQHGAVADSLDRRTAAGEARVDPIGKAATVVAKNGAAKPNDVRPPVARPDSPAKPKPVVTDDRAAALRELQKLRDQLHPDSAVSPDSARAALRHLDALMPRLHERSDVLFAMLYQSHAYYHLGELDNQCAVLRKIRARAGGTRLAPVVESYFGYGKCTD